MSKQKIKPLRFFFYRDQLHRKIHINRGADLVTAWNYIEHKPCKYIYSDVRKTGERAFTTGQVADMVDRTRENILVHIKNGMVERPQYSYSMENREHLAYYWRESDILDLHAYLQTVHIGRPRKDGEVNTRALPSAAELRAMIRQGTVLYVKNSQGEFVPTWKADKF